MAAQVRVRWNAGRVQQRLMTEVSRRMVQAEGFARRQYQRNVGVPYPPASRPGQFPHRRSGRLFRGIRANVNRSGARVQLVLTNLVRYAVYLERGTRRMAARPHLGPTANFVKRKVRDLLKAR